MHVDDHVAPPPPLQYSSPGNQATYSSHLLVDKENADSPKFAGVSASAPDQHRSAQGYSRFTSEEKIAPAPGTHFTPKYNQKKQKQVGIKKGSKYWELGKLGPDLERTEILEKVSTKLSLLFISHLSVFVGEISHTLLYSTFAEICKRQDERIFFRDTEKQCQVH